MKPYLIACLIFFSLTCCQQKESNHIPSKPNVVFILADDLGAKDLSSAGSAYYETPHIDQIAKTGITFTRGYSTSRVCSPSRASLMTGKYTARHGITDWIGARSGTSWRELSRHDRLLPSDYIHNLPEDEITVAEALQSAGYKTFFAGKWHLGYEGSYPEDHGFEINKGGWEKGSPIGGFFSPWNNPKLKNKIDGENLSIRLAQETVDFITQNKDSSFFAFLSFYAVHAPIQTTKEKWKKYRDKAVERGVPEQGFAMERILPIRQVQDNPIYAGLLESMDEAVGLVLMALQEFNLDKNTIVIFTSDNGGVSSGDDFATSNLPLRGGKGYQWEGGLRVPYFITAPGIIGANTSNDYPVTGADLYPTILDLAGIKLDNNQRVDGISLKPIFEGRLLPERPLFWHYPHYGNQGGEPSSIIRENQWKLIHYYEDRRDELYNLSDDPYEKTNLASQNPEIRDEMKTKLITWLAGLDAMVPQMDEEYNVQLDQLYHERIETELLPKLEAERKKMLAKDFKPNENWWGSVSGK